MGGVSWDVAAGDQPVSEGTGRRRASVGISQTTPRSEEAPAQAAKRGQDQTCGDFPVAGEGKGQATTRSKIVHRPSSTRGWLERLQSIHSIYSMTLQGCTSIRSIEKSS